MEQISLLLVVQQDVQDCLEYLFLDHKVDTHCVLCLHNCFEELDDLHVGLD